jgi:D-alanyl-D-alanine-carboxypeptidase/D-alanyl-D-alanine-endopeptidase
MEIVETTGAWRLPTDAAIKDMLARRIERQRDGVGLVVGVIDEGGRRVIAHGRMRRRGRRLVDGRTVFEIGSTTKVFTALLLSDMALRGEVALDDPVAGYLPDGVTLPERGGKRITLADLATHTSGLPRSATNVTPSDHVNPYGGYTPELLYAFLSACAPTREVGARYEYSNIGMGLLGHVLGRRLGTDYRRLIKERVLAGLGMNDTGHEPSRGQARRLAQGHDPALRPAPSWRDFEAVAGSGGLLSTAEDLLKLLAVALGYEASPLKAAVDAQLAYPMRKIEQPGAPFSTASGDGAEAGLGWHAIESAGERLVRHNGGTAGFRAFIGLNPARGWGTVVLANAGAVRGGDDIGRRILSGAALAPGPKRAVAIAPAVLARYVGRYRFPTGDRIEIRRSDEGLAASLNGQGELPIYASALRRFFWRTVDAELVFETDADGRAIALTTRSAARGENRAVRE